MTATAVVDVHAFRNGRQCVVWLRLVPRQHATGGKDRLLGISKRGDQHVHCLLIYGTLSVIRRSQWLQDVLERRHRNVATVALASRMARIA